MAEEVLGSRAERTLSAPDGIKAYLAKIIAESKKRPVHDAPLFVSKDEAGVKAQFGAVGKACGACHENFRAKQ